jgi:hypothetical protein
MDPVPELLAKSGSRSEMVTLQKEVEELSTDE